MSRLDFLKDILPSGTRYSLRLVKKLHTGKDSAKNEMFDSIEEMENNIDGWVNKGWNVYYATAGFGAANNAQALNAVAKRELYVDVDCGPDKPYQTKGDGLNELKSFVVAVGLPRPTIVDSGNGLHAHWIFDHSVPVHEWQETADALKELCITHKFQVDGACTADVVRVLRIPDTINTKGNHPVTLLTPVKHYKFEDLKKIIGVKQTFNIARAKAISNSVGKLTEVGKLLASNRVSKYEKILIKSIGGEGCAQIKWAFENQESVSEPLWRANLSIPNFCEDSVWGIHEISKGHPNYDPVQTESKASQTKGPYTCETFQSLDMADLCQGCSFKGKITSPIQIGAEIAKAPDEPVEVEDNGTKYEIPPYPSPYFRGKNGGVYVRMSDGTEELVYPHDFYVYKRMYDREFGDVACFRHHTPKDGVRDFNIVMADLGSRDKFRTEINRRGIVVFEDGQVRRLQSYVEKQLREIQMQTRAEVMHARFGWTDKGTFVLGNREYGPKGVETIPISQSIQDMAAWFEPSGSYEKWKKVANFYNNPEGDMHALGALVGFGSILMHYTGEHGAVFNFYSKGSGSGKTTLLKFINSISGNPTKIMKTADDKALTKVHRMGIYNGICNTVDEMTNASAEEVSNLLYGATQGRGRDRMEAGRNVERVNNISWKSMSVWSSNSCVEDRLSTIKIDPQGELARVIDIYLKPTPNSLSLLETKRLFDSLDENYGHALDVFLRHIMAVGRDVIDDMLLKVQEKIYSKYEWTQAERFKLSAIGCIITAGVICQNADIVHYDLPRLLEKACTHIKEGADQQRLGAMSSVEMFATFINKNISNMLIISDNIRNNGLGQMVAPDMTPRNTLLIRYEPNNDALYIALRDFNKWCAENYLNSKEVKSNFAAETGKDINVIKKRLGKGWSKDFGPVTAYEILNATTVLGMELSAEALKNAEEAGSEDDR